MKKFVSILMLLSPVLLFAQDYPVGYREISVYDSNRERDITAYAYYPAVQAEENASPVEGTFPYIVFGHGFMMNQGDYDYLYNYLVPKGYFFVSLTTETGASPDHETYAQDLAFVCDNFYDLMLDDVVFHDCVGPKCVVMGHSMGGGASHLASSYTQNMEAIITFAAAETDPSAIDAAANANVPTIVFYGEGDAVAPPDENQIPIYNSSNSDCKILIGINGGIHCYFAESQWACDFGETMSGSDAGIEREEQHDIVTDLLGLYLDKKLKGNHASFLQFVDSVDNSSRITTQASCDFTEITTDELYQFEFYPNPTQDVIEINIASIDFEVSIINIMGQTVKEVHNKKLIDVSDLKPGTYVIQVITGSRSMRNKVIIW
ncbi:MAG TPA: alpha/beta hydrolase [Bacteroidales bacterium]|nr:alpha/beta hydrolase [Bacteroidales bacterium]